MMMMSVLESARCTVIMPASIGVVDQIVAGQVNLRLVSSAFHMKRNLFARVYDQLQLLLNVNVLVQRANDEILRVRFFQYHLDSVLVCFFLIIFK